MQEEWKSKWVAALRSGKYRQGEMTLRDYDDKFCCLGVLCDLVKPDGWVRGTGRYVFEFESQVQTTKLPWSVIDIVGDVNQGDLIRMNDNDKASFEKIADFIEGSEWSGPSVKNEMGSST
jgi:hypothetical protein